MKENTVVLMDFKLILVVFICEQVELLFGMFLQAIIMPTLCFLKIARKKATRWQVVFFQINDIEIMFTVYFISPLIFVGSIISIGYNGIINFGSLGQRFIHHHMLFNMSKSPLYFFLIMVISKWLKVSKCS